MRVTGDTYVMDDAGELGATALDAGTLAIVDEQLRLVSEPAAVDCRDGNELTITNARFEAGALQGTVAGDNCSRGLRGPIVLLHLDPTRP